MHFHLSLEATLEGEDAVVVCLGRTELPTLLHDRRTCLLAPPLPRHGLTGARTTMPPPDVSAFYDRALLEDPAKYLRDNTRHASFKDGGQEQILKNGVLTGKDTFAVCKTGSGKSLTYTLPATALKLFHIIIVVCNTLA
jgi:superfamily II DNA helicase RecQ